MLLWLIVILGMMLLMERIELLMLCFILFNKVIIFVREGLLFLWNLKILFFFFYELDIKVFFLNVMVVFDCFCYSNCGIVLRILIIVIFVFLENFLVFSFISLNSFRFLLFLCLSLWDFVYVLLSIVKNIFKKIMIMVIM